MGTAKSSTFQERFRDLIGEAATQEEIAKKVNSSRQNVGNWLSGKSKPDINALAEIAKGYNVSTDYLLGLTDVKTSDTDIKAICDYTGLSEKAVKEIIKLNMHRSQTTEGSGMTETYRFINAFNYLLENDNFYYFIQPLSCVFRYCKPQYDIDEDYKMFDFNVDDPISLMCEIENYCNVNRIEIVSKSELAELKLSYAQNALLGIFQELIDDSFGTDEYDTDE